MEYDLRADVATHSVVARNLAADTENPIHRDSVARTYGFAGGLVAGITTYAYMTRPVLDMLGPRWLKEGTMSARLLRPLYDGDRAVVRAESREDPGPREEARSPEDAGPRGGAEVVNVSVHNGDGEVCAEGVATLPDAAPVPPDPADWPDAEPPDADSRLPASPEVLSGLGHLGAVRRTFRAERADEFLDAIGDDHPVYRTPASPAHPGWIVFDANQALARNVLLGPWIHVSTEARHFDTVVDGDVVSTRGVVRAVFERRGHQFAELDLLVVANDSRPVWHITHTAIFDIASPVVG